MSREPHLLAALRQRARPPRNLNDAARWQLALREVSRQRLIAQRLARWALDAEFAAPARVMPPPTPRDALRIPLARRGAHPGLEAGKRTNVRLAATALHGVVITPRRPLSFWRAVGAMTEARGYAWGMELRAGCGVPAIGGGACVLANALFGLAVERGWRIVERHAHSVALAEPDMLDATIAYPYLDLRFAPRDGVAVLDVQVRGDVLVIGVHHDAPALRVALARAQHEDATTRTTKIARKVWRGDALIEDAVIVDDVQRLSETLRTCLDCGQTACHARVELPAVAR